MALKKNNPGACAGANCCSTRPCCAVLWDGVRAKGSGLKGSIVNVSSTTSPTTSTVALSEFLFGGTTFYQCSAGDFGLAEPAPPAADSYSISLGITRVRYPVAVDPSTGSTTYHQSGGHFALRVHNCDPSEFEIEAGVGYRVELLLPPDWTTAGFTCVATDGYTCTKWERVDVTTFAELTTTITKISGTNQYDIAAKYWGYFPTVADLPIPLTVAPYYNPASISLLIEWVP